jgi:hypothetical protein
VREFDHPVGRGSVTLGPVSTVGLPLRHLRAAAAYAAAALGTYLAWFGWDQPARPQDFDSPPLYSMWQLIGVALTLLAIAAVATWLDHGRMALVVLPIVITGAAAVDGVTDAWFWQLNSLLTALGSVLVVFYAYVCTRMVRRGRVAQAPN